MLSLDIFRQITADPRAYAAGWKKRTGGKVIGHFCSYAPEEIVTAAGALAFRILPSGRAISRADVHLQSYCCEMVRGTLEDVLAGDLDFLEGVIFPHTCDSIQRLSDIWRLNTAFGFHSDLSVPSKLNTPDAMDYYIDILATLRAELAGWIDTPISDEALYDAIVLHNHIREGYHRLYELRNQFPGFLPGKDWHAVLSAGLVMERALLADHLDDLVKALESERLSGTDRLKRLVLSGGVCTAPEIYTIIEAAGGAVVWDDLCMGGRYFEGPASETATHPETTLARRYAERAVCPAKHTGITSRGDYLVKAVKRCRAQGVIFLKLTFCDPHAFDFPYMKQMLDDIGIPSILIELETLCQASAQIQTRCQAFTEMIE
jgi:bcr-type benzoyl-CoA reductase subunit C